MVQNINISSMCLESYPCQHTCEITLSSGHKKSVTLNNPAIYTLIQELPLKKIMCTSRDFLLHFCSLRDHNISWMNECQAEDILTGIFSKTIGDEIKKSSPNTDAMIAEAEVFANNYSLNLIGHTKEECSNSLLAYIKGVLENLEFKTNPRVFLDTWDLKRGNTEEFRFPEDAARGFFNEKFLP